MVKNMNAKKSGVCIDSCNGSNSHDAIFDIKKDLHEISTLFELCFKETSME